MVSGKVWPASIRVEDRQAQLPRLGHTIGVHVEGLVAHELGGEEVTHSLPHATEAAHEDVVAVILLGVRGEHDSALHSE